MSEPMTPSCCPTREALDRAMRYCSAGAVESGPDGETLSDWIAPALTTPCPCQQLAAYEEVVEAARQLVRPGGIIPVKDVRNTQPIQDLLDALDHLDAMQAK